MNRRDSLAWSISGLYVLFERSISRDMWMVCLCMYERRVVDKPFSSASRLARRDSLARRKRLVLLSVLVYAFPPKYDEHTHARHLRCTSQREHERNAEDSALHDPREER